MHLLLPDGAPAAWARLGKPDCGPVAGQPATGPRLGGRGSATRRRAPSLGSPRVLCKIFDWSSNPRAKSSVSPTPAAAPGPPTATRSSGAGMTPGQSGTLERDVAGGPRPACLGGGPTEDSARDWWCGLFWHAPGRRAPLPCDARRWPCARSLSTLSYSVGGRLRDAGRAARVVQWARHAGAGRRGADVQLWGSHVRPRQWRGAKVQLSAPRVCAGTRPVWLRAVSPRQSWPRRGGGLAAHRLHLGFLAGAMLAPALRRAAPRWRAAAEIHERR